MVGTEGPLRLDALFPSGADRAQTAASSQEHGVDAFPAKHLQQRIAKGTGKTRPMQTDDSTQMVWKVADVLRSLPRIGSSGHVMRQALEGFFVFLAPS